MQMLRAGKPYAGYVLANEEIPAVEQFSTAERNRLDFARYLVKQGKYDSDRL